jgi:succinoglycan biosynthesis protein ExoL
MKILYLAHDLEDAAIWRRVAMLRAGGADVAVAGFYRTPGFRPVEGIVLGRTHNGRLTHRVAVVLYAALRVVRLLKHLPQPDVILARNLEMLALGARLQTKNANQRLVYEVLDIHWTMTGDGTRGRMMRRIEAWLGRRVELLIISSAAFNLHYFGRYNHLKAPVRLVENKVFAAKSPARCRPREEHERLVIGWFGILRCAHSLAWLDNLTRRYPGRFRILLRGRPERSVMQNFDTTVASNPDMAFEGSYDYSSDLADLYSGVDLAWLIDRLDAGANSDWLLPNRLYEGSFNGAVPVAVEGTETARFLRELAIGVVLPDLDPRSSRIMARLDRRQVEELRDQLDQVPTGTWASTAFECASLVQALRPRRFRTESATASSSVPG